jgi:hypothetical protein
VNTAILLCFAAAAAAVAIGAWREPSERARRTIAKAPRKRLGETRTGDRAVVRCVVKRGLEEAWSPLTGRPCVAYSFVLRGPTREQDGTIRYDRAVPFIVEAEGLEAIVKGRVAFAYEPRRVPQGTCRGLADVLRQEGRDLDGFWGMKTYSCQEALLRAGDEIMVLGRVSIEIDPAGRSEDLRGPPMRRVIRGDEDAPVVVDHVRRPDRDR